MTADEENLLFTREELASDIASILKGDEHSPEALAHLFIILRNAVAGGRDVSTWPLAALGGASGSGSVRMAGAPAVRWGI